MSASKSENRPDLVILVHDLSATGVARNAVRIANAMADRGLQVEIWRVRAGGKFEQLVSPSVRIRTFASAGLLPWRRLEIMMLTGTFARAVKQIQPRILFSAGNHFHWAARTIFRKTGRPSETRLIGRASNAPPRIWMPLVNHIASAVDAWKYRDFHKIVAVSSELGELLITQLKLRPGRVLVVPNGVDIEAIESQAEASLDDPWFATNSPPVIVAAGRLSRQKNFPLLLKAFTILRHQRAARLLILGDGPRHEREKLSKLAISLGIEKDVRLHGFEANPMRYFTRSDLFVLSSLWEGMSNVVLEALACGCPVVATDCPTGVREQLDGGSIGQIVTQGDPQALATAMANRLDEPRNSRALRAQAAKFSLEKTLDEYHAIFRSEATQATL